MCREQSIDPENPHADGSDNRQNHRHCGISHSSQSPREQIHQTAQKIGHSCVGQNLHTTGDHVRLFAVDVQKLWSKEISNASKPQCHNNRQDRTVNQHSIHSFQFFYTIVLAGKAHACLGDGIDRHIQESKNIVGCCISCHGNRAKGVNR